MEWILLWMTVVVNSVLSEFIHYMPNINYYKENSRKLFVGKNDFIQE